MPLARRADQPHRGRARARRRGRSPREVSLALLVLEGEPVVPGDWVLVTGFAVSRSIRPRAPADPPAAGDGLPRAGGVAVSRIEVGGPARRRGRPPPHPGLGRRARVRHGADQRGRRLRQRLRRTALRLGGGVTHGQEPRGRGRPPARRRGSTKGRPGGLDAAAHRQAAGWASSWSGSSAAACRSCCSSRARACVVGPGGVHPQVAGHLGRRPRLAPPARADGSLQRRDRPPPRGPGGSPARDLAGRVRVGEVMILAATLLWSVEVVIAKRLLGSSPRSPSARLGWPSDAVVLLRARRQRPPWATCSPYGHPVGLGRADRLDCSPRTSPLGTRARPGPGDRRDGRPRSEPWSPRSSRSRARRPSHRRSRWLCGAGDRDRAGGGAAAGRLGGRAGRLMRTAPRHAGKLRARCSSRATRIPPTCSATAGPPMRRVLRAGHRRGRRPRAR